METKKQQYQDYIQALENAKIKYFPRSKGAKALCFLEVYTFPY